jgi:hypothetical protein
MEPGVKFIGVYGPVVLLIALAVTFFGSLAVAATSFPGGYDWRYKVMSSLASPRENPQAYRIAAGGMAASGVFLALLGLCIRTSLEGVAPSKWTNAACLFFVIGGLLITISALITPGHHEFLGLEKAHAKFAQAGTLSFNLGMALTLPALLALSASKKRVRIVSIFLVVMPATLFLLARILLPTMVSPDSLKTAVHPPLLGSLAFWEWMGSVTVCLYTGTIVLALGSNPSSKPSP